MAHSAIFSWERPLTESWLHHWSVQWAAVLPPAEFERELLCSRARWGPGQKIQVVIRISLQGRKDAGCFSRVRWVLYVYVWNHVLFQGSRSWGFRASIRSSILQDGVLIFAGVTKYGFHDHIWNARNACLISCFQDGQALLHQQLPRLWREFGEFWLHPWTSSGRAADHSKQVPS